MPKLHNIVVLSCLLLQLTACQLLPPTDVAEITKDSTSTPTKITAIETLPPTSLLSSTPTAIQDVATLILQTPTSVTLSTSTPTLVTDTETQLPTDNNIPTVSTSDVDVAESTPEFQVIEAQLEIDDTGQTQLSLPITLNQVNLQLPVEEIIYLTITENVMENLSEARFWRADIRDVNNPQLLHSDLYLPFSGPSDPILSPDGRYIVYGLGFNDRTHSMHVVLLDINTGVQTIVDDFALDGGAALRENSQTFLWSTDSQSFIYVKDFFEADTSEIHQYFLNTKKRDVVLTENDTISLVSWHNQKVYYLLNPFSGSSYPLKSTDVESSQIDQITSIEGSYAHGRIETSPDNTQALFNNNVLVNLLTKHETRVGNPSQLLWLPDSMGFLSNDPIAVILDDSLPVQQMDIEPLTIKYINGQKIKWINWSPSGQYLIYRIDEENSRGDYFLLDVQKNETQIFNQPIGVIGWN